MPLTSKISEDGRTVTLHISGRFDFNMHRDFRQAYENAQGASGNPAYVIDLGGTDYMDSSALGMLLLLREYAGGDKANISIINCRAEIKDILDISKFGRLFKIS